MLGLLFAQLMSGLASASSLFLVASGLSIVFGVTRTVNFAHGAFYMLGAYAAYELTDRFGVASFWPAMLASALIVAVIGALVEMTLLRRIYDAPELFQLLATFGVTLMVEDLVLLIFGPEDLLGPRAPGLSGAVVLLGKRIPSYDLFLIALGPIVLGGLWLLFHRSRFGVLVRAATQDREMVASLGVNQKWLFTGVFALGVFLAALGGALQLPRDAVNHGMDLRVIVDVFVVVVIGGLGSTGGAFVAAIIVSLLNSFGILILPKISLVLAFLVMAAVLSVRPWGLFGQKPAPARAMVSRARLWRALDARGWWAAAVIAGALAAAPLALSDYALGVAAEVLIFALFAASLHLLMSVGGLASFGHAAYFGLGSYGAALAVKMLGAPLPLALAAGVVVAGVGAAVFGRLAVTLSGVYFAMLTLALAQIVWSVAFQWVDVTGGDNGIVGVWPPSYASSARGFFWLTLGVVAPALAALQIIMFSPFGYSLRATRDSELRAEALGINRMRVQWAAFVIAGCGAGLAGGLYVYLKGSVFPDSLGIPLSVDGLVMVLIGGVETVFGPIVGAVAFKALSIWLISETDYSKLALGAIIVLGVVLMPKGLVGSFSLPRLFAVKRA
jgi:branched-chain amino acid transport system permease protein